MLMRTQQPTRAQRVLMELKPGDRVEDNWIHREDQELEVCLLRPGGTSLPLKAEQGARVGKTGPGTPHGTFAYQ